MNKKKRVIKNKSGDITGNVLGNKSNITGEIKTNLVETKKESILKQIIVRTFNILKEIM